MSARPDKADGTEDGRDADAEHPGVPPNSWRCFSYPLSVSIPTFAESRPPGSCQTDRLTAVRSGRPCERGEPLGEISAVAGQYDVAGVVSGIAPGGAVAATAAAPMHRQAASLSRDMLKSLRLHQWSKNFLVFAPIILAGQFTDVGALVDTLFAFFALCMVASSTYLVNDIRDLEDDRRHWSKCRRPLASGRVSVAMAAATVPIGITIGFSMAAMASTAVVLTLMAYLAITIAYTFGLKRLILIDGVILAMLFTLRLALGIVAADVPPSTWLVVFSMFLFASLSYAKRHAEIARVAQRHGLKINGRGYRAADGPLVLAMGLMTGIGAVAVLVLYIVYDAFAQTFYGSTAWLWGFPPLVLLFVGRIWFACLRDELDDDPVAFALTDWACLVLMAVGLVCFVLAWGGLAWR
jgi:4-hydroxybenzoate polyprenyltransferase